MLTTEQIRTIHDLFAHDRPPLQEEWDALSPPVTMMREGKVVPKGRPRKGKGGRMYTPPETVEFEKAVGAAYKEAQLPLMNYPIRAELVIYDKTADALLRRASLAGLIYYGKKDLDNMAKSIFDGLNKIAFKDDKQVVDMHIRRRYSRTEGFRLRMHRAGLSDGEWRVFAKINRSKAA